MGNRKASSKAGVSGQGEAGKIGTGDGGALARDHSLMHCLGKEGFRLSAHWEAMGSVYTSCSDLNNSIL